MLYVNRISHFYYCLFNFHLNIFNLYSMKMINIMEIKSTKSNFKISRLVLVLINVKYCETAKQLFLCFALVFQVISMRARLVRTE